MKPLPWIAMGLVVIILVAPVRGYDALPDPLGWLLVAYGTSMLPPLERRPQLLQLAGLAVLGTAITWSPSVVDAFGDAAPSMVWVLSLPAVGYAMLLCHQLGRLARATSDRRAAGWFGVTLTLTAVAGVLPVLVFGGGLDALAAPLDVIGGVAALLLCVLLFVYASRPWAVTPAPA